MSWLKSPPDNHQVDTSDAELEVVALFDGRVEKVPMVNHNASIVS
jgi:hypothetical protein